jgi:hypothetical protein
VRALVNMVVVCMVLVAQQTKMIVAWAPFAKLSAKRKLFTSLFAEKGAGMGELGIDNCMCLQINGLKDCLEPCELFADIFVNWSGMLSASIFIQVGRSRLSKE